MQQHKSLFMEMVKMAGERAGWGPGHRGNRVRFGRVKSETL